MSWLSAAWGWYATHSDKVNPVVAGLGGAALVWAAVRQARTATNRHYEQTRADQQRRLTESFSKAVEQLSDRDKIEARLGGIYTLERLAIEAIAQVRSTPWWRRLHRNHPPPADTVSDLYWTVMETLTAFVRERTRPEAERLAKPRDQRVSESAYLLWKNAGMPEDRSGEFWSEALEQEARKERPATDIAAVLQVLRRRPDAGREREELRDWRLDLRMTDLRGAALHGAHLEGADLGRAHLEGANLNDAHLDGAVLSLAHLEGANLNDAHLDGADLSRAHLDGAYLGTAHLEGAVLSLAHLERADLSRAHLERAVLSRAHLDGAYLNGAHLEGAALVGAHLEGADLRRAHLEGAYLGTAHLDGAWLVEAHLEGADLSTAHLDGACVQDLHMAHGDAKTRLPEGVARPEHWPPYAP